MADNPDPNGPATKRQNEVATNRSDGSGMDTVPAGGSEKVGAASYEEVPRPATNLIYAAVLAVVVIVVIALIVFLVR